MTDTATKTTDTSKDFSNALNVMNAALAEHRDDIPYKQILAGAEKLLKDRNLGVAIYEDDPSSPFDFFTIRFQEGNLQIVSRGKKEPDLTWKVSRRYLEDVAKNSDEYIKHPAKLDWDWLKSRLGI